MVPVVLLRETAVAFELLWALGSGLIGMGHPVVALDASCRERPGQPGLAQYLDGSLMAQMDSGEGDWLSLAAQTGLETLMHTATTLGAPAALARLAVLFPVDAVVLVLAPKEWVCVLFEDTAAQPLVPFVLQPAGVVDAYGATKVLLHAGGMSPVLVPTTTSGQPASASAALHTLLATSRTHLGQEPSVWDWPHAGPESRHGVYSAWMLRMFSSALLVDDQRDSPSFLGGFGQREALVPQLWSC